MSKAPGIPVSDQSSDPRKAASEPARESSSGPTDVVLIHGVTPDGRGLEVLRKRSEQLEAGALRPVQEGCPIHGELVKLTPRPEFPLLCDVETQVPSPSLAVDVAARQDWQAAHKGPAKVASDEYRRNWDLIWSRPRTEPDLPN